MGRANGDGHGAQIQATVKGAYQIETGRKDQGHMVARIYFAAFLQQSRNFFGTFMQFGAGQRFGNGSCGTKKKKS